MSAANSLDSTSFLITTRPSVLSLREGSGLGGRDKGLGEASGETGGVSPSRVLSAEFSDDRESVCFSSLLLESLRLLFYRKRKYKYNVKYFSHLMASLLQLNSNKIIRFF